MRDVPAVRDATRRARPMLADRVALLAEVGGPDLALLTGLLLGVAARRTPVVLDGPVALACALVAHRVAYRAADWWLAADTATSPVAEAALARLGLEPVADLRATGPPGLAGLLAVPPLRAAAAAA
jgi:nicotinate-nucleotide--dimethylbenzimidazole phosphoribosyltransferase